MTANCARSPPRNVGADEYTQKRRVVVKRTQINLGISGLTTVGDTLRVRSDQPGLLPGYAVGFLGTVLRDSAQFSLAQGTPPFTGAFRHYRPLSVFRGSDPEGDWILQIYDRIQAPSPTSTLFAKNSPAREG